MGRKYTGIDVLGCVQGNTAMNIETGIKAADHRTEGCVVFDFTREVSARVTAADPDRRSIYKTSQIVRDRDRAVESDAASADKKLNDAVYKKRRIRNRKRKAARARRVNMIRALVLSAFLTVVFIAGGIVSRAQSRRAPEAYKYYDTITVAYQENILDIVLRYDNRDYYDTQSDYLEELCRINNIAYDRTAYPEISPGTHLVVPYYSTELK